MQHTFILFGNQDVAPVIIHLGPYRSRANTERPVWTISVPVIRLSSVKVKWSMSGSTPVNLLHPIILLI
jgi:hypothetical protein